MAPSFFVGRLNLGLRGRAASISDWRVPPSSWTKARRPTASIGRNASPSLTFNPTLPQGQAPNSPVSLARRAGQSRRRLPGLTRPLRLRRETALVHRISEQDEPHSHLVADNATEIEAGRCCERRSAQVHLYGWTTTVFAPRRAGVLHTGDGRPDTVYSISLSHSSMWRFSNPVPAT